jgi:hypothetical protein
MPFLSPDEFTPEPIRQGPEPNIQIGRGIAYLFIYKTWNLMIGFYIQTVYGVVQHFYLQNSFTTDLVGLIHTRPLTAISMF